MPLLPHSLVQALQLIQTMGPNQAASMLPAATQQQQQQQSIGAGLGGLGMAVPGMNMQMKKNLSAGDLHSLISKSSSAPNLQNLQQGLAAAAAGAGASASVEGGSGASAGGAQPLRRAPSRAALSTSQ